MKDSEKKPKEKHSKFATFAAAFAISGVLAPLGLILGLVDMFILRQKKKGLSIAAIFLSALWIVVGMECFVYLFPAGPGTLKNGIVTTFAGAGLVPPSEEDKVPSTYSDDSGSVFRICSCNDDMRLYTEQYYPDYVKIDDTTGMIGDITVQWTVVSKENGYYDTCLADEILASNGEGENPIDIFITDAGLATWFSNSPYTLPLNDIGLDDETFSDSWAFTRDIASDENGVLKAATYDAEVCAMLYNRRIAKAVFGTDDPEIVQANVNDLDLCYGLAAVLTQMGYRLCVSPQELYYLYCQNSDDKIVIDDKINIYDSMIDWTIDSKNMIDWDCALNTEVGSIQWAEGFVPYSNTFCYVLPMSMLNVDIEGYGPILLESSNEWGICMGPGACYYPEKGNYLFVADGTDNSSLCAEFIKTVTTDLNFLDNMANDGEFVNSRTIMYSKASNENSSDPRFCGQNIYVAYCQNAERLKIKNITKYDYQLSECYMKEIWSYFGGYMSLNETLNKFRKRTDYLYGLK